MYSRPVIATKYLHYRITAGNGKGHGMHSPFVFDLVTKVMNDKTGYPAYAAVESLRNQAASDNCLLDIIDLGAGSGISKTSQRTVASVLKGSVKSRKYGQLLYRLAGYYQPETMIELGTSLGLSAAYLALGNPFSKLITIEGSPFVAEQARQYFRQLNMSNIRLMEGHFDDILPQVLKGITTVDLAFIDGNHREEPTLRYFQQLLEKRNNDSLFIFDDIHWSTGMEQAWEKIKAHPEVTCTVDLFFLGLVFFRKEFLEKQHFTIRF